MTPSPHDPNPAPTDPVALAARDQRRAADPTVSAWVAASAGSGKTKVLTDRVLNLLLAGAAPERILCLTFTKAAAAEMANRMAARLATWSVTDDASLARALEDLSGERPDPDRMALARRLFARVLDTPGGMRIQTIHAFCQSVLRRFPLEAGLSPSFQVMDDATARDAAETALGTVLNKAGGADPMTDPLTAALATVTSRVSEDRFPKLMAAMKNQAPRLRRLFAARGGLAAVRTATYDRLGVAEGATPETLDRAACAEEAFDGPGLRAAAAILAQGTKTDQGKGDALAAFLAADPDDRLELLPAHEKTFFDSKGQPRDTEKMTTKGLHTKNPEVLDILAQERDRLIRLRAARQAASVAEATGALLTVADAYLRVLAAYKDARALLDFDDLVQHTRTLLERADGAAWVLYKLDGGIDHLLIDEAQDTSPDQWAVARTLTEEFHAGLGREGPHGDGLPPTRTVFAVGDRKQSIYSFQGADPAGFEAMRTRVGERVRVTGQRFEDVGLHVSFRSTPAVLEAVNRVFAQPDARDGVALGDEDITHTPARVGQAGMVEVWPPVDPPELPDPEPWKPPVERLRVESAPSRLARVLAARIHRMITAGERLEARDRPIRAGDILVLVRRRTGFVTDLTRALKTLGVAVAGADRMVLTDQIAVMDLIALGNALLLPEDDLTLATVLKGPLIGLTEEELFTLAHGRASGERLWHRLEARAGADDAFGAAWATLADLMARVDRLPPHELYARILDHQGGRRGLLARLGPEADDPIDEFMALALAHDRNQPPSLGAFLRSLAVADTEIKRDLEHGGAAVRVMTVHGSKGLQAPVVILPDTLSLPHRGDTHVYFDGPAEDDAALLLWPPRAADRDPVTQALEDARVAAEEREYRRLLYVALTRAEDRLILCGWNTRKAAPDAAWHPVVTRALTGFATKAADPALLACGLDEDGATILRHRSAQTRPPRGDAPDVSDAAPDTTEPPWLHTAPAPDPRPSRPLAPSEAPADPPPVSPLEAGAGPGRFRRGLLVHRLLQHLPGVPPADRADAAWAWLSRPAHGLDAETAEALAGEVLAVLDHPELAAVFGPGSRAEVPIVGVVDTAVVSGQVDRLHVTPERVTVVDFKTSRPAPTDPDLVPSAYLRQMALYRAVLTQVYPDRPIVCALVWTAGPGVMVLDPARLDATIAPAGCAS
ncbi:double-strand break repair helicase AddA [Roseospira marina]|uniref:DNA 3'-5' helicase n=1 Tax=Roseospira marina TaxID=140057 RepID=A0A5M6IG40_9PROT|nr:double-strand break repair helicase AddA [Roseospira marina]KAA5607122.1 double-strand break repair helicase AddA [Roseospira marina]MBB4312681.1 ATP-dependent helicase/nuclease subunit A [Roseospira marina]MBB5086546.1 ATP-dependent helicase/nuclease subunit A [Roseospira marina]